MRHEYFEPEKELAYYKHDSISPLRNYEPSLPKPRFKGAKEVVQMDMEGKIIATHDNARDAALAVKGDYRTIQKAARGELEYSYSFKWKYKV